MGVGEVAALQPLAPPPCCHHAAQLQCTGARACVMHAVVDMGVWDDPGAAPRRRVRAPAPSLSPAATCVPHSSHRATGVRCVQRQAVHARRSRSCRHL